MNYYKDCTQINQKTDEIHDSSHINHIYEIFDKSNTDSIIMKNGINDGKIKITMMLTTLGTVSTTMMKMIMMMISIQAIVR